MKEGYMRKTTSRFARMVIHLALNRFVTMATVACAQASAYPVVDTAQTSCYDQSSTITAPSSGGAFAGQDAQYAGAQMDYTISGDGLTVYDNVTGLTWTRSPDTDDGGDQIAFTGRLFGAPINDDDRTLHLGVAYSDRNIDVPVDQKGFGLDIELIGWQTM